MTEALRGTILVVDDDAGVRDYVSGLLREAGYTVLEAIDGQDAKRKVHGADVIFLDLDMPNVTGEDFVAWLRARGNYVPVVVMTAWEDRAHALRRIKSYDIVHILLKPMKPEQVLHRAMACNSFTKRCSVIGAASTEIRNFITKMRPLTS